MLIEKVCPVVVRAVNQRLEILSFRHPLAGLQLAKGTKEPNEDPVHGALRELIEESGVIGWLDSSRTAWTSDAIDAGQLWHFIPAVTGALPDRFAFWTRDDGGHEFAFFWWPLADAPGSDWHPIYPLALAEIRQRYL